MAQSDDQLRNQAAALAEEVAAGLRERRAVEWLEEVLGSALINVARRERDRCAAVADQRAEMWEESVRRMAAVRGHPRRLPRPERAWLRRAAVADALRVSIAIPTGELSTT